MLRQGSSCKAPAQAWLLWNQRKSENMGLVHSWLARNRGWYLMDAHHLKQMLHIIWSRRSIRCLSRNCPGATPVSSNDLQEWAKHSKACLFPDNALLFHQIKNQRDADQSTPARSAGPERLGEDLANEFSSSKVQSSGYHLRERNYWRHSTPCMDKPWKSKNPENISVSSSQRTLPRTDIFINLVERGTRLSVSSGGI